MRCDQPSSVDLETRNAQYVETVSEDFMEDALACVRVLLSYAAYSTTSARAPGAPMRRRPAALIFANRSGPRVLAAPRPQASPTLPSPESPHPPAASSEPSYPSRRSIPRGCPAPHRADWPSPQPEREVHARPLARRTCPPRGMDAC